MSKRIHRGQTTAETVGEPTSNRKVAGSIPSPAHFAASPAWLARVYGSKHGGRVEAIHAYCVVAEERARPLLVLAAHELPRDLDPVAER